MFNNKQKVLDEPGFHCIAKSQDSRRNSIYFYNKVKKFTSAFICIL